MPQAPDDAHWMRRALELAQRGWGRVHPNPLVGAVVVRDGAVVAEGWHAGYGGPHAEAAALEAAGTRARGATLYVSLEPCAHHGKTPPCVDAVVRAGVARVVIAAEDPNPKARGGAELLRAAGIEIAMGVERDAARAQNAAFFHWHEHATPFVALKLALSVDARIAARRDAPTPLTGAAARAEVHRLRAGFDAVLVGIGTVLSDDPLLTARGTPVPRIPPMRVVFDSSLRLPPAARMLAHAGEAPVWVVCAEHADVARERALLAAGARVLRVSRGADGVDVPAALELLASQGVRSVLCEGGAALGAALLRAGAVRRLILFRAPILLGGGVPAFDDAPAGRWRPIGHERLGEDLLSVFDRDQAGPVAPGRREP